MSKLCKLYLRFYSNCQFEHITLCAVTTQIWTLEHQTEIESALNKIQST